MLRPNREAFSTAAALVDFLSEGPGTLGLDEVDHTDKETRERLLQLWNLGHKRGERRALMVKGRRVSLNLHAPMIAAGIGGFLGLTQMSRSFVLEMQPYTNETKPELEFDDNSTGDLDAVYSFLRHWASRAKLNPNPAIPAGLIRRHADNARGLLAVADACGPDWGKRVRAALVYLFEKGQAERPEIAIIKHGLAIFEAFGLDQIGSIRFNRELRRLDLPDARWTRFRGPSGMEYAHPIAFHEQAALLAKVGIESKQLWPPGRRERGGKFRGYTYGQFEEAWRKHGAVTPGGGEPARLHLVPPASE